MGDHKVGSLELVRYYRMGPGVGGGSQGGRSGADGVS